MKELIIIVYKINVNGQSAQRAEQNMHSIMENYSFTNDEELKKDYTIREIYLPTEHEPTDVKIIYPVPRYVTSPEINDLVEEISNKIKEDANGGLKQQWERLVRELKLRKLNNTFE
jgi:hypothetical protein